MVHKEKLSLMGEMAGSLMHDLRNPVKVILSVGRPDPDESFRRGDGSDCCEKSGFNATGWSPWRVSFWSFREGETKLRLARTDTSTLLQQFLAFNEDFFAIGVKFAASKPSRRRSRSIRCALLRVLQNLVSNAVEAMSSKPGGRIDLRAWVADSMLYLSVDGQRPGHSGRGQGPDFRTFVTHGKRRNRPRPGDREECGHRASRKDHI